MTDSEINDARKALLQVIKDAGKTCVGEKYAKVELLPLLKVTAALKEVFDVFDAIKAERAAQ